MAEISDQELSEIYAFAVQLGKDAGDLLMAAARRRMNGDADSGSSNSIEVAEKESSVDIVTQTDHGIYQLLLGGSESHADIYSRGRGVYSDISHEEVS